MQSKKKFKKVYFLSNEHYRSTHAYTVSYCLYGITKNNFMKDFHICLAIIIYRIILEFFPMTKKSTRRRLWPVSRRCSFLNSTWSYLLFSKTPCFLCSWFFNFSHGLYLFRTRLLSSHFICKTIAKRYF